MAEPSNNGVSLSWTLAAEDSTQHVAATTSVYVVASAGGEVERIERIVPAPDAFTVTGLRNGVEYSFVVYAASDDGRSGASTVVSATPSTGLEGEVAGLIVKFAGSPHVTDGQMDVPGEDRVSSVDLTADAKIADDVHLIELSESVSTEQAAQVAAELQSDPSVEWAEPDVFVFPSSFAGDPEYESSQWNLWDEWGLGLPRTSTSPTTSVEPNAGAGVTVAVIDTGITSHPDLDSQLVPGYDFVSDPANLAAPRVEGGPDVGFDADGQSGRDADPTDPGDWRGVTPVRDSTWHGTQVAGIIAAQAGNSEGIVGVAPGAKIQPIRALSWRGGLMSDIISSITWASGGSVDGAPANANPAAVITMSFAAQAQCSVALQDAIDDASGRGSILVAAAGNANSDVAGFAPANCSNVIAVGATGRDGKRAPYSNYGPGIDISAPGGSGSGDSGVLSTSNSGVRSAGDAYYSRGEGTSIAAAHVAGAIARARSAEPELAVADLRARILGGDQVRAFPDDQCDADPNIDCGSGVLTLAQVASTVVTVDTTYLNNYNEVALSFACWPGAVGDNEFRFSPTDSRLDSSTTVYTKLGFSGDCTLKEYGTVTSTGGLDAGGWTPSKYLNSYDKMEPNTWAKYSYFGAFGGNTGSVTIIYSDIVPTSYSLAPATQTLTGTAKEEVTPTAPLIPSGFSAQPTFSASALPDGLTIDPTTGVISGTPLSLVPTKAVTITAAYGSESATAIVEVTIDGYIVDFNTQGNLDAPVGTTPTSLNVLPGSTGTLPAPSGTASNHLFGGWYSAATGGDFVGNTGDTYAPPASLTLYARWLPTVRIQYNLDGGSLPQGTSALSPYYAQGSELTLPTPTKDGRIFTGWYTQLTGGTLFGLGGDVLALPTSLLDGSDLPGGSTLQRYARWRSPYNYWFVPNGGTFSDTRCVFLSALPTTCRLTESAPSTLLPSPTRASHRFDGWWSKTTGGIFYGEGGNAPLVDLGNGAQIQARWTAFSLTRSSAAIDAIAGAAISAWTVSPVAFTPTQYSISPALPTGLSLDSATGEISGTPTGSNVETTYTVTAADGNGGSASTTVTITVVAMATVTFDSNGGAGSMNAQTASAPTTLTLNTFNRSGFTFAGWNSAADGTGTDYVDGDLYDFANDVTLYAQWEAVPVESPVRGGPPTAGPPADSGPPVTPPRLDVRPPRIELDTPVRPTPTRPGAGTIGGEEIALAVERDEENTELDVSGAGFSLTVATLDTERVRIAPTSQRSLVAPVRGFVEVAAAGYAPQSIVALYLTPTLSVRMSVRNASELYFLGEVSVGDDQTFAGDFQLPGWALAGEYSLQINGYTPAGALKSINLRLDLIDRRADAVSVARACVFPDDQVKLTSDCRQSLRSLKQVLPAEVDSLTLDITGVAYAQGSKKRNKAVALERAQRVERFLERNGIVGDVTVDVVMRKGLAPGLTLGPPPVVVGDSGKPASTVVLTVEWTTEIGSDIALSKDSSESD